MTTKIPTTQYQDDRPPRRPPRPSSQDIYIILLIGAAVALIALLVILFVNSDDNDDGQDPTDTTVEAPATIGPSSTDTSQPTTASTASPTTSDQSTTQSTASSSSTTATTTGSSTTGQVTVPTDPTQAVVWPAPGSGTVYETPEAAAQGFAEDFIGFDDPVLGDFRAGDSRSGEIELQPQASGPVSTILLRQVGSDGSWSVIAVENENIMIDTPDSGQLLANPMALAGEARAFEGHVDVRLYASGQRDPVAEGFVTGRGDGVLGAFDETIELPKDLRGTGILVLTTANGDDGSVWDVAAIPIRFS